MKIRLKIILFTLLSTFMLESCIDLRSCDRNVSGKYYCKHNGDIINYIEINENGTFFHYYKEGKIELSNEGTWKKNSDGYCNIELSEWKDFNEKGLGYEEFGNGILYINRDYLDISPDGDSASSFIKE